MSHEQFYDAVRGGDRTTRSTSVLERALGRIETGWNVARFSAAYLSIVTMVEVGIVMVILSIPFNLAPVIGGLITFAVYANDRIADVDADAVSKPAQAAFVRRHESVLYVLSSVAYGLGVALSVLGGPLAFALALLPGAAWVLYGADWLPNVAAGIRRLKEVLVVNSAVVALAWAVSLTFMPVAFAGRPPSPTIGLVFAYFFLRSYVDAELPNIDDRRSDEAAGVRTLPVVFGVRWTRNALLVVDVVTIGLVGVGALSGLFAPLVAMALLLGVGYSVLTTALVTRPSVGAWTTIAPELEYVLVGVALVSILGL